MSFWYHDQLFLSTLADCLYKILLIDMAMMVRPDERAVMTYLSCFYHAFQGLHQVIFKPCFASVFVDTLG